MGQETEIRAIIVRPCEAPVVQMIPNTLAAKQQLVGGFIEVVCPFDDNACIICNEMGKLQNLPLNRLVGNDIICGTFIVCGTDSESGEFISLTDEQVEKYTNMFKAIEVFITPDGWR